MELTESDSYEGPIKIEEAKWYVQKSEIQPTLIVKPCPGYIVCDIPRTRNMLTHAALLSTAPQLLKACKQAEKAFSSLEATGIIPNLDIDFLRDSISAATAPPSLPPDEDIDRCWEWE